MDLLCSVIVDTDNLHALSTRADLRQRHGSWVCFSCRRPRAGSDLVACGREQEPIVVEAVCSRCRCPDEVACRRPSGADQHWHECLQRLVAELVDSLRRPGGCASDGRRRLIGSLPWSYVACRSSSAPERFRGHSVRAPFIAVQRHVPPPETRGFWFESHGSGSTPLPIRRAPRRSEDSSVFHVAPLSVTSVLPDIAP